MRVRDGKAIKATRKTVLRLKQRELAAICSVQPSTMNRIENGKDVVPGYVETIVSLLERDHTAVAFMLEQVTS